jgi:ribosomal protein L33
MIDCIFNVEEQKGNNYVDKLNWTKNEKRYENIKFC